MPNNPGYRVPRPPIGMSSYGEDDDATVRTSHYVARHGPPTVRTYRKNPRPPPHLPKKPPNNNHGYTGGNNGSSSTNNNSARGNCPAQHPLPPPPLYKNGQPSSSRLDPTDSFRPPTGPKRHRDDGWPQRGGSKRPAPQGASPDVEEEFFNGVNAVARDVPVPKASKHGSRKPTAERRQGDASPRPPAGRNEDMGKTKEHTQRTAAPLPPGEGPAAVPPPRPAAPARIVSSVEPAADPSKPAKMKFKPVVPKKNRRMDAPKRSPGPFRPLADELSQDEKQDVIVYDVPDEDEEEEHIDERTRAEGVVAIKRADIPIECWEGSSKSKEEARSVFRNKERAKLTAMGRKAVAFLWRSDGLGIEWRLSKPPEPPQPKGQEPIRPAKRARTEERQDRQDRIELPVTAKAHLVPSAPLAAAASSAPSSSPAQPTVPLASRSLSELESEVMAKIEAIDRWTSMMEQLPTMAIQLQRQINRVQTEIFDLTEQMKGMQDSGN